MLTKKMLLGAGALALGATVFAHHVSVGLSSSFGGEIVDKIVFFEDAQSFGVPAYALGGEDHHFHLTVGDSFVVTDEHGLSSEFVVRAEDYADPADASMSEVLAALQAQLGVAQAAELNSTLTLRGMSGGDVSSLTLTAGVGSALTDLSFTPGTIFGADDVELTLSVPLEDHGHGGGGDHLEGLAHAPYVMVGGLSPGVTQLDGVEIPLEVDPTALAFLRAAKAGLLPGFVGELDANQDATAVFPSALLDKFFPNGTPDELHFAYVVFNGHGEAAYASNRFTVTFVK